MSAWTEHVARWRDCTRCPLAQQRANIVLARGQIPCTVLFVGEAPGASEDALGRPFVGPAGQLLDQIIDRALPQPTKEVWEALALDPRRTPWGVALDRAKERGVVPEDTVWVDYALTNLVACFPAEAKARGDNEPEVEEILACRPRLGEFIDLCRPRLVVRVGSLAGDWVEHDAYGKVRGAAVCDVTHPAAILRMPLAQKQMAVQRVIVTLRTAIRGILE